MIHVTPEARTELHGLLTRALAERSPSRVSQPDVPQSNAGDLAPEAPQLGFRLVAEGAELGLALDAPREGDRVVEQDGLSVLILDSAASELVKDLTLDVAETPEGTRLALRE